MKLHFLIVSLTPLRIESNLLETLLWQLWAEELHLQKPQLREGCVDSILPATLQRKTLL